MGTQVLYTRRAGCKVHKKVVTVHVVAGRRRDLDVWYDHHGIARVGWGISPSGLPQNLA